MRGITLNYPTVGTLAVIGDIISLWFGVTIAIVVVGSEPEVCCGQIFVIFCCLPCIAIDIRDPKRVQRLAWEEPVMDRMTDLPALPVLCCLIRSEPSGHRLTPVYDPS
jgi:hypothetical protein